MAAVNEVTGAIETPEVRNVDEVRKGFTSFTDGDVIFAKITPCMENGKAALAERLVNGRGYGSTEFFVLRSLGPVEPRYLHQFVRQESYRREARSTMQSGVGQARVPKDFVESTSLPLPPLPEQRRIVAKLDELRARSRMAREALGEVPALLDRLKQSVLAAAFRGDLTAEWRAAQPAGSVEPASVLLDRIRAERRKRWEQANPKKKYVEPEPVDTEGLPELPEGWCWARLEEVSAGLDYGTSAKSADAGLVPVLRMGNLQGGEIDWSDLKYTSDETEIEKYGLAPNTVLFNRTNSPELVGKTAIYRGHRPAVFAGYLIRIDLLDLVEPDFVNLSLNSLRARAWCWMVKSDGVSQSNINATKLGDFPIPLCSGPEQSEICRLARAHFDAVGRLAVAMEATLSEIQSLDQSALLKAFRGELVPQHPNDEPAQTLLARVRADGGDAASKKRGRGGKGSEGSQ
jgi:type I restriction enzyme S subunit